MPLGDVTVHAATPVLTTTDSEETWIEGEPDEDVTAGVPFDCLLIFPSGARSGRPAFGDREQSSSRGRRKVDEPRILYEAERDDGSLVQLVAEDEVIIDAPELLGEGTVTVSDSEGNPLDVAGHLFQVEGDPTPMAPPGEVIGWQATLKRVLD